MFAEIKKYKLYTKVIFFGFFVVRQTSWHKKTPQKVALFEVFKRQANNYLDHSAIDCSFIFTYSSFPAFFAPSIDCLAVLIAPLLSPK